MAPAGPCQADALAAGVAFLKARGFEVLLAPNALSRTRYLAGSDAERLAGIEWLLDRGARALIATRGGYGAARILHDLPWERLAAWHGWVVGFSDLTALHSAMATRFPRATLHAPMVASFGRDPRGGQLTVDWLTGRAPRLLFEVGGPHVLRPGIARGISIGGTLSLLAALVGTPFEPDYDGAVVFLEEINEPLYRLDRLLTQLRLSSRLGRATAVIAGRLVSCGRGEERWRDRWRELLLEAAPGAVVAEGLPFGHGRENVPFPLGVEVEVDTVRGEISWGGG